LANALHLLPHRDTAVYSVGIKLDAHRLRVEIVQKDFNFKHVVVHVGFDPQVSDTLRALLPIDRMLPIYYLRALFAPI